MTNFKDGDKVWASFYELFPATVTNYTKEGPGYYTGPNVRIEDEDGRSCFACPTSVHATRNEAIDSLINLLQKLKER